MKYNLFYLPSYFLNGQGTMQAGWFHTSLGTALARELFWPGTVQAEEPLGWGTV